MPRPSILLVDDDVAFTEKVREAIEGLYDFAACHSVPEFRLRFDAAKYDLVIMDMRLERGHEGLDLVREILSQDPGQPVVIATAYADTETYLQALEAGALSYLDKRETSPVLIVRMIESLLQQGQLQGRVQTLEKELAAIDPMELVGASTGISIVRRQLRSALEEETIPILLRGERGVGKELVARNLHRLSHSYHRGPFVVARPAAIREEGHEDTLLGVDGSSQETRRGWLEEAQGGILYLDDVGALSRPAQRTLAAVLNTGRFVRNRGSRATRFGARVVASVSTAAGAQSRDLVEGLHAWLHRLELAIPPLRERADDIPLLAMYFLQRLFRQGRTSARSFDGRAMQRLEAWGWPGNVEELRVSTEYAALRSSIRGGFEVRVEDLPAGVGDDRQRHLSTPARMNYQYQIARAEVELVDYARRTLATSRQSELANALGYNDRFTFARRISRAFEAFPGLRDEFPALADHFPRRGSIGNESR